MHLFDTHCHLQDERLAPGLRDVMQRAALAGVQKMVCCGSCETDWMQVIDLAEQYAGVVPALGVHPWYVTSCGEGWLDHLTRLLHENPRAAVGEIGLDHTLAVRSDAVQMSCFYRQLILAQSLRRPVSVHCRKAWGALLELLRREPEIRPAMVIHSYSGPAELIAELQKLGICISFSGSITFANNGRARNAAKAVAATHLLIETDSPYLPPYGWTDVNEPSTLANVANELAALREVNVDEIIATTTSVAENLFECLPRADV